MMFIIMQFLGFTYPLLTGSLMIFSSAFVGGAAAFAKESLVYGLSFDNMNIMAALVENNYLLVIMIFDLVITIFNSMVYFLGMLLGEYLDRKFPNMFFSSGLGTNHLCSWVFFQAIGWSSAGCSAWLTSSMGLSGTLSEYYWFFFSSANFVIWLYMWSFFMLMCGVHIMAMFWQFAFKYFEEAMKTQTFMNAMKSFTKSWSLKEWVYYIFLLVLVLFFIICPFFIW